MSDEFGDGFMVGALVGAFGITMFFAFMFCIVDDTLVTLNQNQADTLCHTLTNDSTYKYYNDEDHQTFACKQKPEPQKGVVIIKPENVEGPRVVVLQ